MQAARFGYIGPEALSPRTQLSCPISLFDVLAQPKFNPARLNLNTMRKTLQAGASARKQAPSAERKNEHDDGAPCVSKRSCVRANGWAIKAWTKFLRFVYIVTVVT